MNTNALKMQLSEKFAPHSRWVVALSGGADSVALLRLLCSLREERHLTIFAAHVHHGLRDAADADLAFVRRLCRQFEVPLYSVRIQLREIAKSRGLSLEAAGRACRYDFLLPLAKRLNATVATAHTLNDQAETMLLYLLRGNGPNGLAGIREWREDGVFRPLLTVSKDALLDYLTALGQPHREDESNASSQFLRNRIRHEILPLFLRDNPAFLNGIARSSRLLQEDNEYLEMQASALFDAYPDGHFPLSVLSPLHPAVLNRVIRMSAKRFCGENNLPTTETDCIRALILKGVPGKQRPIGKSGLVQICNKSVNFSKTVEKAAPLWYNITVPASVPVPFGTLVFSVSTDRKKNGLILDADKIKKPFNLVMRSPLPGDRIAIADHQHQKISDLLINRKIPKEERKKILLLCQDDTVLAVFPFRVAYGFTANPNTTRYLSVYTKERLK